MRNQLLRATVLSALLLISAMAVCGFDLRDHDAVVFYGDSITD